LKITALVEAMVKAGATPELILVAVRATEAQELEALNRRRKSDADRQAKHRMSRDITLRHSDRFLARGRDTRAEDKTSNTEIEPQLERKKENARSSDLADFRSELSALDTERLDAIVKHRRAKKAQITGHAARLFVKDAQSAGLTLSQAVDTCIARNWITVKAEWLIQARAGPKPKDMSAADIFGEMAKIAREKDESNRGSSQPASDNLLLLPVAGRSEQRGIG